MASFITVEGGDGSGKSTLLRLIQNDLKTRNVPFILTREPGGTHVSEMIRKIILDTANPINARTELLLYEAARSEHVEKVILPALSNNKSVLCDRFTHSSIAYQGVARKLGIQTVSQLNQFASFDLEPNLVIWIKLEPETALLRIKNRDESNRLDLEKLSFHKLVFEAFETMAKQESDRFIVLDGTNNPDLIFQTLLKDSRWQSFINGS